MSYKLQILADVTKAYVQPFIVDHQCMICGTKLGSHLHSMKRHIERGHPVLAGEIKHYFDTLQIPMAETFDFTDPKYSLKSNRSDSASFSEDRHPRERSFIKPTPKTVVITERRSSSALTTSSVPKNTQKSIEAMDNLIKLYLTSSIPLSSLNNRFFISLLSNVDGFTPPTIAEFTGILKSHVKMYIDVVVTEILLSDLYYSVSVDVSHESNTRSRFLGITLHYYLPLSNEVKTVAIELVKCDLSQPIRINDVVKQLLEELNLPLNRLVRIVTGSGRVKETVFRHQDPDIEDEEEDDETDEFETNNTNQVMDTINNVLGNSNSNPQAHVVEEGCINLSLLSVRDTEKYIEMLENTGTVKGFKDSGFTGDHITCVAHRLQQVCETVFEQNGEMADMRDRVLQLLAAFARSSEAVQRLRAEDGSFPIFPANKQWTTMEKVFNRITEIHRSLYTVSVALFGDSYITSDDLRLMEYAVAFLRPFNQYMAVLQRPSVPALPLLFTGLSHLMVTLEDIPAKYTLPRLESAFNTKDFIASLCTEIKDKFADILCPGPTVDPTFVAASALDATVAPYLLPIAGLTVVRDALIHCVKKFKLRSSTPTPTEEVKPVVVASPFGFGPPIQVNKPSTCENGIEKEVEYLIYLIQNQQWNSTNAFDLFDVYNLTTLKQLAFILASVPATSAAVDRLFTKMSDIDIDLTNKTEASIFKTRSIGAFNM